MSRAVDPCRTRCGSGLIGIRYRCNLGLWVVAFLTFLPLAVIDLLGPAFIAVSEDFSG